MEGERIRLLKMLKRFRALRPAHSFLPACLVPKAHLFSSARAGQRHPAAFFVLIVSEIELAILYRRD
jgi:hypothetical protein